MRRLIISLAIPVIFMCGCDAMEKADQALLGAVKKIVGSDEGTQKPDKAATPSAKESLLDQINQVVKDVKKISQGQPAANDPLVQEPAAEKTSDDDAALREELNGYIACLNRVQSRTQSSYRRYLSWVNKENGPSCKERYISYGLYSLYQDSIVKCDEAAYRGLEAAPELPELEKVIQDLAKCNKELIPLVQRAVDYYDQEDYKDDACAQGKALHPQLVSTFERCLDATKKLGELADTIKLDLDKRDLKKIAAQGENLRFHVLNHMINAKSLLNTINLAQQNSSINNANYLAQCEKLETDFKALSDYAAAHPQELSDTFWGSSFMSSAKTATSKAKFLRRDLEAGKNYRRSLVELVKAHNDMISSSNNLRFK